MEYIQSYSEESFNETKKLSKEDIEKIFSKYTKHFSDFFRGLHKEEEEEKEEENKTN